MKFGTIILLLFIGFIISIFEKIGVEGFIAIIIIVIIAALVGILNATKPIDLSNYQCDEFGPIITDPKELKKFLGLLFKKDFELYSKHLALHHLRESFYIILKSKNEETIRTRIDFAIERLSDLKSMNIPKDEFTKIENKFNILLKEAQTTRYINQIAAYIDKIHTLKTKKAKEKYYNLAKDLIFDARKNQQTEQIEISKIEQELNNIII